MTNPGAQIERSGSAALAISDAELARLGQGNGGERFYIDESILDGEGVPQAFIDGCKELASRITGHPNILDYHTFPRDREGPTFRFFEGENFQYTGRNEVNNPLQLIRPRILSSPETMVRRTHSAYTSAPKNWAQSASERGLNDRDREHTYATSVAAYEKVFIAVLESTNIPDDVTAREHVEAKLAEVFEGSTASRISLGGVAESLPDETPAGWLMNAALSVLIHPGEAITPAARIRALRLIEPYTTKELFEGFTSHAQHGVRTSHDTGLIARGIKPRLPFTLCAPNERHLDEHKNWETSAEIKDIMEPLSQKDYRNAANAIIGRPQEAVQLATLMLHSFSDTIQFGISLLRAIPQLDRKTQAFMFGPYATFYTDNKISNNLQDQVAEGVGTRFDPSLSFDGLTAEMLENSSGDDLKRFLASALLQLRRAEELAASLVGNASPSTQQTRQDPEGFFAILGIDPSILDRYDENEVDILINGAARTMSKVTHPDKDGSDEARNARQQAINIARDALMDAATRSTYGK